MFVTYMHPFVGKGRATLAIFFDPETRQGKVGIAYSLPKDKFVRKLGRQRSLGRLEKGSFFSFDFILPENGKLKEYVFQKFIKFTRSYGPPWAAHSKNIR